MQNGPKAFRKTKKATRHQLPFQPLAQHARQAAVTLRQANQPVRSNLLPHPQRQPQAGLYIKHRVQAHRADLV